MKRSPDSRITRPAILLACLLAFGPTGCDDDITGSNAFEADEPFNLGAALTTQSGFRLEGINGVISIVGTSTSDSILISGTRIVGGDSVEDAEAHLGELTVDLEVLTDEIVIRTVQPQNTEDRLFRVDYEVVLPADLEVDIQNANGVVTVAGLTNRFSIINANGDIGLADIAASLFVALGNGEVIGEAEVPADGTIEIAVGNGEIDLGIPATTSADFSATVGNGEITIVNLVLQDQVTTSGSVTGRLGGGDGDISLDVGNGTIRVTGV